MSTFWNLYKAEKKFRKSLNAIRIFVVCLNQKTILGGILTKVLLELALHSPHQLNEIMVLTIELFLKMF